MIQRYLTLTTTSILCYADEFKATRYTKKPIVTIPLTFIKSIERVKLKSKGTNN